MKQDAIQKTIEDHIVDAVVWILTIFMLLVTLIPLMNVFSKAFSSNTHLIANTVGIWPRGFQTDTMKSVITSSMFWTSFTNSVLVMVGGTILSLVVTSMAAYSLAHLNLPLRKPIMLLFVFTMLFSAGTVPSYLAMKNLALTNTLWSLILPAAANCYNMLLVINYFATIPVALEESAHLDGAGIVVVFVQIMIPLALPVLATVCLFTAVELWNNYFRPMLYNTRTNLKTLAQYLYDIIMDSQMDMSQGKTADDMMNVVTDGIRSATIVASTLPILSVYPFLQKYFIKGVMIGAIKG